MLKNQRTKKKPYLKVEIKPGRNQARKKPLLTGGESPS
jgi:hypothetical protein